MPLCIKVGLMTGSNSCKSQSRRHIWPHGSEMFSIGSQQVAHSNVPGPGSETRANGPTF